MIVNLFSKKAKRPKSGSSAGRSSSGKREEERSGPSLHAWLHERRGVALRPSSARPANTAGLDELPSLQPSHGPRQVSSVTSRGEDWRPQSARARLQAHLALEHKTRITLSDGVSTQAQGLPLQHEDEEKLCEKDGDPAPDSSSSPDFHDVAVDHDQTILFAKKSIVEAQIAMKKFSEEISKDETVNQVSEDSLYCKELTSPSKLSPTRGWTSPFPSTPTSFQAVMAQTNVEKDVVRLRDKDKKAGKFSSLEKLASRKSNKMRVDALHKCIKAIEKLSVALDRESAQNKTLVKVLSSCGLPKENEPPRHYLDQSASWRGRSAAARASYVANMVPGAELKVLKTMPQDWLQSMEKVIALKLVNAQLTAELAELENKRSEFDPPGGEGGEDGRRMQHQGASIHAAANQASSHDQERRLDVTNESELAKTIAIFNERLQANYSELRKRIYDHQAPLGEKEQLVLVDEVRGLQQILSEVNAAMRSLQLDKRSRASAEEAVSLPADVNRQRPHAVDVKSYALAYVAKEDEELNTLEEQMDELLQLLEEKRCHDGRGEEANKAKKTRNSFSSNLEVVKEMEAHEQEEQAPLALGMYNI